jgi:hypothetical protein
MYAAEGKQMILRWILGLWISLAVGAVLTHWFLDALRKYIKKKAKESDEPYQEEKDLYVPGWFVGLTERTFFTVLVAFDVSATAAAMIGWVAVKVGISWQVLLKQETTLRRSLAFSALLGNIVSMLFAVIGGVIIRVATFSGSP